MALPIHRWHERSRQSMMSAQASVGVATVWPTTGTILMAADATRRGAAASHSPMRARKAPRPIAISFDQCESWLIETKLCGVAARGIVEICGSTVRILACRGTGCNRTRPMPRATRFIGVEQRPAFVCQHDDGSGAGGTVGGVDQAVGRRVFPGGQRGATGFPGFHGVGVAAGRSDSQARNCSRLPVWDVPASIRGLRDMMVSGMS